MFFILVNDNHAIEASPEDKCLYGKLLYVNDLVTYEATTVAKLEKEFIGSVNEYLKSCEELGCEA